MNEINVSLPAKEIAEFPTFSNWVNTATSKLAGQYDKKTHELLCVDSAGFICSIGADFMAAQKANRFPVKAYLIKLSRSQTA